MNNKVNVYRAVLLIVSLCLIILACDGSTVVEDTSEYVYHVPAEIGDGWNTASLTDVGMDVESLEQMMDELLQTENDVDAILVIKEGKLVFEEYFKGKHFDLAYHAELDYAGELEFGSVDYDSYDLHFQASATKSITSILVGIALDKGFIHSLNDKMLSYFPEYAALCNSSSNCNAEKQQITLEQMLTMTSGLNFDDSSWPITDPRNDERQLLLADDPIAWSLGLPMIYSPGAGFEYNSATTTLLGEIVERTSGMDLTDFADQYVFEPLGITTYDWVRHPKNTSVVLAAGGLYLRPRDMAKVGQLFLNEGVWEGEAIISRSWITESTQSKVDIQWDDFSVTGYGQQWWIQNFSTGHTDAYMAAGWGGQHLIIIPEKDMVIVLNQGDYYLQNRAMVTSIVDGHILPALR